MSPPIGDTRHCWNCWATQRTSCAGCDDEAVYTMGRYNEGRCGTMCRAEGLEQAQGRGIVFGAPTRWRDTFLGWGGVVRAECLPFYLPSIPSLFPPTCTTTCYSPPCKCVSGNLTSQWKLDPGFFPFCRASNASISIVWGYFSEMGLGRNGD